MRRVRGLLLLLALAAVLAGCTGTTENVPPLLLAVGRIDTSTTPAQPQMVLVEDNFSSNQTVPRTISVVAGSARNLTYPAVASDVVDRAGTRNTMVVLTRDLSVPGGPSPAPASRLLTFNLAGIVPSSPTAFAQTGSFQLTGGTNPIFSSADPNAGSPPWCFSGVTVSLTGRFVTLLDNPAACGDTSGRYPRLFQLDTGTSPVTVTQVEVAAAGVQTTQATVPFDDQASSAESLYFLVPSVNDALLYADPVPHQASTAPTNWTATLASQDQTKLVSNGTQLVATTNQYPDTAPPPAAASSLEAADPTNSGTPSEVPTVDGARAMAVDPMGITKQVVVVGANQLAVHSSPTDSTPSKTPTGTLYTGVAATIDPINQFAYVVNDNRVTVLDLLTVAGGSTNWYAIFSPNLPLPVNSATGLKTTAMAWTRAAP